MGTRTECSACGTPVDAAATSCPGCGGRFTRRRELRPDEERGNEVHAFIEALSRRQQDQVRLAERRRARLIAGLAFVLGISAGRRSR